MTKDKVIEEGKRGRESMKRLFVACIAVMFGVMSFYPSISYAERIYCSTYNGVDYAIERNELTSSSNGLLEIGVYGSDGDYLRYGFRHKSSGEWKYCLFKSRVYPATDGFQPVSDNQLANDVLYAILQADERIGR